MIGLLSLFIRVSNKPPCNTLSPEQWNAFCQWAFGLDYHDKKTKYLRKEFNKRHGSLLTLQSEGRIENEVPEMINIWKKQR